MRLIHQTWMLLALVFLAGCSSADLAEVADTTDQLGSALSSTLPVVTALDKPDGAAADAAPPFDDNLDFFTPPKMVIPIEPDEVEEDTGGELPPLRLVGFVGTAGDKAMVNVKGKMHIVTAGKRLNGVEIVTVASPNVGLRWGETELTLNFYTPNKADRIQPKMSLPMTFSPGLANAGQPASSNPAKASPKPAPVPRPQSSLPPLPGLPSPAVPSPGAATAADLGDFPDLGSAPGAPPAL